MATPRIIVSALGPSDLALARAWAKHAATLLDRPQDLSRVAVPASVWHVVSTNNRTLGRRIALFGTVEEAIQDSRDVLGLIDELVPAMVRDQKRLALSWVLRRASAPIVVGARWYSSDRDRRAAAGSALEALRAVALDPRARTFTARELARPRR